MNRRETIKTLMAASGALVALPSWAAGWTAADVLGRPTSPVLLDEETLAAVADTIIPEGDGMGAIKVGVDKFLQRLFADCYESEVQENVRTQLRSLEHLSQVTHQKSFNACDQTQREQMLLGLSTSQDEKQRDFFKLIKSETIRGFRTSREVMVGFLNYQQVPGHYYGCVDAKT